MSKLTIEVIERLGARLEVDIQILTVCIDEEIVEVAEVDGEWDLQNGTALRLRRLQRLCHIFSVDIYTALLFSEGSGRT